MKVAIITHYWKNSPGGGVRNYVINLVNALKAREGIDVIVIFKEGEDKENIPVGGNRYLFPFRAFVKLMRIRPGVVHSHGTWYCLFAGVIYKKFFKVKLIHTFHTEPTEKERLCFLARIFMQFLVDSADCVTFVSNALKSRVEEVWGLHFKKTAITRAGVRIDNEVSDKEIADFRTRFNIPEDSIILLAQGMTAFEAEAKGVRLLIEAMKSLKEIYPNIRLIVTREGVYSNELKSFVREIGVEDYVIFTGDVSNPLVPLKLCHIYTHITFGEGGSPLSLLEAMAMGKPIIASKAGGIPEAIRHEVNGLLVNNDLDEICQAVHRILNDRAFSEKCAMNAKLTADADFTVDSMSERFLEIYR